jgi:transcriptional regulator GlxA family with amidase domain
MQEHNPPRSRGRDAIQHSAATQEARRKAVLKVIALMKQNLTQWDQDLTLASLAREGAYSQPHLIEIFEEVTGTTPKHFLASLRIDLAKKLFLTTKKSATDVALEVGYE